MSSDVLRDFAVKEGLTQNGMTEKVEPKKAGNG
jgi:hypothetical protein